MITKYAAVTGRIISQRAPWQDCGGCGKNGGCEWAKLGTCKKEIPAKYASILDAYKQAADIHRVAAYNPEFLYSRVIGVHGDVPNTNGDLFRWGNIEDKNAPELLRFDDVLGKPVYSSFVGKGNYKDHQNDSVSKAVGILLDAVPNHNVKGIELLIATDRNKDPYLVRGIELGYITDVSMGAVRAGTKINLPSGDVVTVDDVIPGMEVLTHKGNYKKIKVVQKSDIVGTITSIKVEGTEELFLTGDHPCWVISGEQREERTKWRNRTRHQRKMIGKEMQRNRKSNPDLTELSPSFVESKDVKVGDYIGIPFPGMIEEDYLATKDFARLMGYYASEGWFITQDGKPCGVGFCLNINEKGLAKEIEELCKKIFNKKVSIKEVSERNGQYLTLHDHVIAQMFYDYCGKGAKTKTLSQKLIHWKPELQLEFLGAFINGDGFQVKNGMVYCSTASDVLARQLQWMFLRCGIVANRQTLNHKANSKNSVVKIATTEYQVAVGAWFSKELSFVCKVIDKRPAKWQLQKFIKDGCMWAPIKKKDIVKYEGIVYDLQVESDESFVANGLAVHNCRVAYSICSICDHVAHTEDEYCDHIKNHKGGDIDGKPVYEDNRGVEFIEESWVTTGADAKAKFLEKVASRVCGKSDSRLTAIVKELESEFGTQNVMGILNDAKAFLGAKKIFIKGGGKEMFTVKRSESSGAPGEVQQLDHIKQISENAKLAGGSGKDGGMAPTDLLALAKGNDPYSEKVPGSSIDTLSKEQKDTQSANENVEVNKVVETDVEKRVDISQEKKVEETKDSEISKLVAKAKEMRNATAELNNIFGASGRPMRTNEILARVRERAGLNKSAESDERPLPSMAEGKDRYTPDPGNDIRDKEAEDALAQAKKDESAQKKDRETERPVTRRAARLALRERLASMQDRLHKLAGDDEAERLHQKPVSYTPDKVEDLDYERAAKDTVKTIDKEHSDREKDNTITSPLKTQLWQDRRRQRTAARIADAAEPGVLPKVKEIKPDSDPKVIGRQIDELQTAAQGINNVDSAMSGQVDMLEDKIVELEKAKAAGVYGKFITANTAGSLETIIENLENSIANAKIEKQNLGMKIMQWEDSLKKFREQSTATAGVNGRFTFAAGFSSEKQLDKTADFMDKIAEMMDEASVMIDDFIDDFEKKQKRAADENPFAKKDEKDDKKAPVEKDEKKPADKDKPAIDKKPADKGKGTDDSAAKEVLKDSVDLLKDVKDTADEIVDAVDEHLETVEDVLGGKPVTPGKKPGIGGPELGKGPKPAMPEIGKKPMAPKPEIGGKPNMGMGMGPDKGMGGDILKPPMAASNHGMERSADVNPETSELVELIKKDATLTPEEKLRKIDELQGPQTFGGVKVVFTKVSSKDNATIVDKKNSYWSIFAKNEDGSKGELIMRATVADMYGDKAEEAFAWASSVDCGKKIISSIKENGLEKTASEMNVDPSMNKIATGKTDMKSYYTKVYPKKFVDELLKERKKSAALETENAQLKKKAEADDQDMKLRIKAEKVIKLVTTAVDKGLVPGEDFQKSTDSLMEKDEAGLNAYEQVVTEFKGTRPVTSSKSPSILALEKIAEMKEKAGMNKQASLKTALVISDNAEKKLEEDLSNIFTVPKGAIK